MNFLSPNSSFSRLDERILLVLMDFFPLFLTFFSFFVTLGLTRCGKEIKKEAVFCSFEVVLLQLNV